MTLQRYQYDSASEDMVGDGIGPWCLADDADAEIARLEAENARVKDKASRLWDVLHDSAVCMDTNSDLYRRITEELDEGLFWLKGGG